MKIRHITLLIVSLFVILSIYYTSASIGIYGIDPRYDRDWYSKYSYFHYGAYYVYGEVKGWYVPGIPGYYSSDHYGYASMGGYPDHENRVTWIKICGRGFDSQGNLLIEACTRRIYSSDNGVTADGSLFLDYTSVKAYKAQTKIITRYYHYHYGYYYAYFDTYIPYSYIEVNY